MSRSTASLIEFQLPTLETSFRVKLLREQNPSIAEKVLDALPLSSVVGHVVVSGGTIWLPTRIVHLGPSRMVDRTQGAAYFYAPGQTICLCYGAITESGPVNTFGQVLDEHLETLRKVGQMVWDDTVVSAQRRLVPVTVRAV